MAAGSWQPDSDIIDFVKWLIDTNVENTGDVIAEAMDAGDLDTGGLPLDEWLWKGESQDARDCYEYVRESVETDSDVQRIFNDWKISRQQP